MHSLENSVGHNVLWQVLETYHSAVYHERENIVLWAYNFFSLLPWNISSQWLSENFQVVTCDIEYNQQTKGLQFL